MKKHFYEGLFLDFYIFMRDFLLFSYIFMRDFENHYDYF